MRGWRIVRTLAFAAALILAGSAAVRGDSCGISAVGVSFGTYNVFGASPLDSTGSVTYTCSSIKPSDRVTINLSRGSASTFSPRQMRKSAETLNYNLYLDAARTTIWGDLTSGTSQYGPIHPVASNTITIYGRIPAGQDASAGTYSDTVVATINF